MYQKGRDQLATEIPSYIEEDKEKRKTRIIMSNVYYVAIHVYNNSQAHFFHSAKRVLYKMK